MKKVCLNINFDSLFFPLDVDRRSLRDPSYFQIADRFFDALNRVNAKATIFIIGRDLENPEVFARVRSWAEAGHEIGNHTWTHHHNLGALPKQQIEDEVLRAHDIITRCVGREPRGFISPAWSTSKELVDVLIRHGYLYDTSVFPSPVLALAMTKLSVNARTHGTYDASWIKRRDKLAAFFAPRQPYFVTGTSLVRKQKSGLLMLPMPTTPVLRIPCWHTMSFFLGPKLIRSLIKATFRSIDGFYYLMHPADLTDFAGDLDPAFRERYAPEFALFERLTVPIARKMELFRAAFETLTELGEFATLEEIAREQIKKLKIKNAK